MNSCCPHKSQTNIKVQNQYMHASLCKWFINVNLCNYKEILYYHNKISWNVIGVNLGNHVGLDVGILR